jgi:PAS domain S-box-containing protein
MARSVGGSKRAAKVAPARPAAAAGLGGGQSRVLEMIAKGLPLAETLAELVRVVEAELPDTLGSILLLDDDGVHLRHGAAPNLPATFCEAIDGLPIGPRTGSCGTAAFRREAVIVEDIAGNPLWADYRTLAAAHGLRACWSTPIFGQKQQLIGTFAMYQREPGRPSERHLQSIAMATHVAAIAIVREREERALRQNERRLRGILEGMTTGFIALDLDWRFTEVNARAAQIIGRSAASMLGRKYLEVFPEAAGSAFEQAYRRAMQEQVAVQMEQHFAPWDRWFEQRVEPTPGGVLVFFQDITERKRDEEDLRRFRLAMDNSADMILLIDRERMRFVDVNPAVSRLLGYSREEMLAMGPQDVLPVSREELAQAYDALIANPATTGAMNSTYRRKDGSLLPFESTRRVQQSGGRWIIAVVSRDITERLAAETRIRRLNRVYAVLSGINSLIVRERDRDQLLREACRIAVEAGGLRMCWAAVVEPDGRRLQLVASQGVDDEYLRQLPLGLDEAAAGHSLAARSIAQRLPVVVDDLAVDPKVVLRAQARERGLHSAAFLPLAIAGRAIGVLALYATEVAYFDAEEMKLLTELAGDISFGLEQIDKS